MNSFFGGNEKFKPVTKSDISTSVRETLEKLKIIFE